MRPRTIPQLTEREIERFWQRVEKAENCWLWKGAVATRYGTFTVQGQLCRPHRIAYTLSVGEIPAGLTLDHLCRNKLCCNPAHLEPVTQSENTLRYYRGLTLEQRGHCKYGHDKRGKRTCPTCMVRRVAATMRKYPEKYREMRRLQKQKERARKREALP